MSFCKQVKQELCKQESKKFHCEQALLYGGLLLSRTFPQEAVVFTTENKFVADRFTQGLVAMTGFFASIHSDLRHLRDKMPLYTVCVEDSGQRESLAAHFHLNHPVFEELVARDCCKIAFLRGIFLAYGSMNNPEKEYHLEMTVPNFRIAEDVFSMGEAMGIRFKLTSRKQNAVLYLKESEQIEDFLTLLGAVKAVLQLMNVKVLKDVRNKVNRKTNCETANLKKTVDASQSQVQAIRYILDHKDISFLEEELRELALLRVENEDLSLQELAEMLSTPLSRSGVNHRLKRIVEAADRLREKG